MSIKGDLRKMAVHPTPVERGTVMVVKSGSVLVSSPVGMKEFQTSSNQFIKGDTVKFQGNTLLGKTPGASKSRVYTV